MSTEQNFTLGSNVEHFTIGKLAQQSPDFRRVLWTGKHSQIVIMTIPAGGEIGEEVHENSDQILTFVSGTGVADLAGHTHPIEGGDQCAVPAGTLHNFRNTGDEPLVIYTVYSPRSIPLAQSTQPKSRVMLLRRRGTTTRPQRRRQQHKQRNRGNQD
jgi:mannose-6-phosphate isomerase-like protein (cupin superfamily)